MATILIFLSAFADNGLSQDWVHPANRYKYQGYEKHKNQKRESDIWTYATNRPLGNTKGGGTISYWDYQPSYKPEFKIKHKKYIRPKKIGEENSRPCNCNE